MTESLPHTDRASYSVLRVVVGSLITLIGCLAVGLFMTFSLTMVQELVHALGHSKLPLSWFGLAMDDGSWLPIGISFIVVVPAVLMRFSDLLCGRPARLPSWLLPTAMFVVLAALAGVWVFEGSHLAQYLRDGREFHHYAAVSIGLAAAMGCSLILTGVAHFLGRRLRWLGVVGPLACIAWVWFLLATEPIFSDYAAALPAMASPAYLVANLLIVAAIVAAVAWIERRLHGQLDHTFFVASAALWATAGLRMLMSVGIFSHMCEKVHSNQIEDACKVAMQAILVFEVIAIAVVTVVRRPALLDRRVC